MHYRFLLIALAFNAGANILLKIGAMSDKGTGIRALLENPYAIAGVAIFASNVYFYIQALRVLPISLVYPIITAAGFLIINSYGILMLKEPVSILSVTGYVLIIVGITLLAVSYK
ncbi:MAG: SMR family transporter [Patescibacteria group bacterium]